MLAVGLTQPRPGLKPKEYRDFIKTEILNLGVEHLLAHKDFVILYSGPSKAVRLIVGKDPLNNHGRSFQMAMRMDASRIDDTEAAMFGFLGGKELDDYFRPVLSPDYPDHDDLDNALNAAYAEVWGGISELFAKMDFRHAATAVCGADHNRVFVRDELPALIENLSVETINGIDMAAVRTMYNEVGADEAFKLICLSELKVIYGYAGTDIASPTAAWADFFERLSFFENERKKTEPKLVSLTTEQEKRKQEIIRRFNLAALYATAPSEWGGPIMPVSRNLPVATPSLALH